jgi:hypothetical protein
MHIANFATTLNIIVTMQSKGLYIYRYVDYFSILTEIKFETNNIFGLQNRASI